MTAMLVVPGICFVVVMAFMAYKAICDWISDKVGGAVRKRLDESQEELWRKGQADAERNAMMAKARERHARKAAKRRS